MFGLRRPKQVSEAAPDETLRDLLFQPNWLQAALDRMTAQCIKTVDDGLLVCLAVQRTSNDTGGNVGLNLGALATRSHALHNDGAEAGLRSANRL